nr:hypothetical protein [Tanacetum cinerariifolium]
MAIKESKDLSSLALEELIDNLKVHEVVMEKDSETYRGKKERIKSIALKAKKKSSDDETLTSESDDEEYAMDEKKGKSYWKCFRCGDPNHLIGDCPKPSCNKDQKAFIGGSVSDSENDTEDKTKDETCIMAQSSNEIMIALCEISIKIINKNKILEDKRDLLENEILELNEKIKKLERSKEIEIACKSCEELKSENIKIKETQVKFVKFDKSVNSLREMLNNQESPSCKIGLGFNSCKASTSRTKIMSFVESSTEKASNGSTIKVHGSTMPGSVCLRTCLEPNEWIKDSGCSKHMTGENHTSWSDKLDDALWAFCTAYKTPIGCTPYKLTASDHRKVQINELNELRDQAYENSLIYKEKSKRLHDSKIKNRLFNIGDRVLLFNISHVFPYGTVKLTQPDGPNFKVNGHCLKHYFREDIPKLVVLDLQTFANDH